MGYRTPNIDRIANEGMRFTDSYGEQSCTAGRSSFITGQSVFRTGPEQGRHPGGADVGLRAEDPTIAELLKPLGYATGQFGKNHLGDRNEFLPTRARLRRVLRQPLPPQRRGGARARRTTRRPTDFPHFRERFGPRGVLHCWATDEDDATEEPRWGRVGKQRIEDTGPLTKKRMETIDDEFLEHGARLHRPPGTPRTRRSSSGSTRPTCTCGRTRSRRASGRPGAGSRPTTTR